MAVGSKTASSGELKSGWWLRRPFLVSREQATACDLAFFIGGERVAEELLVLVVVSVVLVAERLVGGDMKVINRAL
ncbi:hypothetical protein L6164_035499 [Bauhinia variegata]|uniref:Uncharacterized protein n=1 Tax=Bauhinia variegata TaxID=167791 RepID=A0ACB9KE60_BAUVA|nr:hypothetical protein L6164_035499 [Bauhinia variegata]